MNSLEYIKQMLILQQKLNDETNGKGWENGFTKEKKIISWKRCIYMECAELIDSFAWKHWKNINAPINKENVKIELVDIWHFILSLSLEKAHEENMSIDELATNIISVAGFSNFELDAYKIENYNIYEIINEVEMIINLTSGYKFDLALLLKYFFSVCLKCELNLNSIFKIYMGKNVLNKFRQDFGYKNGTYKKVWNGKEDNEVLSQILIDTFNADEIYKKLEENYSKVK